MEVRHQTAVDADAIRYELEQGRRTTSSAGPATAVGMWTMNFVVFLDDAEHRDWVRERTMKIGDKHPSRTLLLDACIAGDEASIVTITDGHGDPATIRTERVEIPTGQLDPARLGSLVQALSVPGVPTVLWWTAAHVTTDPRFAPLADFASGVLVDSSGTVRDGLTLGGLEGFWERHPSTALLDLAWMRLGPWRDIIARFFDAPALREELFSLRKLRIDSGSDAEALYLAGWLASRLGWRVTGRDTFTDRKGAPVQLDIRRSGDIRRIVRIELDSERSNYAAAVTADPSVVELRVDGARTQAPLLATLPSIDNASLIERAILQPKTDEIFEVSLRIAAQLLHARKEV